jgi:hypothetical protein
VLLACSVRVRVRVRITVRITVRMRVEVKVRIMWRGFWFQTIMMHRSSTYGRDADATATNLLENIKNNKRPHMILALPLVGSKEA